MDANIYYLELMSILLSIFQLQKLMSKTMKAKNLSLIRKDKRHQKKKLGCIFIRINTSNATRGYGTDYEVSKIQIFISKFKDEKITELEDEIKKLKLQLTNQSVLNRLSKKGFTKLQRIKNTQSKIKPIKTGKELGTTYFLGCKDFTHNYRLQEVKMTNKVLREK